MNELVENPVEYEEIVKPPFEVYYFSLSGKFLIKDLRGKYMQINKDALKTKITRLGVNSRIQDGHYISDRDKTIDNIMMTDNVDYVGELAGYQAGVHTVNNAKILVTKSPTIIKGDKRPYPILSKIFEGMFNSGDTPQLDFVYGWLKLARESVASGNPTPGQCLVLAGPKNCGKSLFQDIVTELLGGRTGRPFSYMSGKTDFNSELFGAEHLVIADENSNRDMNSRRLFGSRIKDYTVNTSMHCHGKFREALTLTPCQRLTISLNDEDDNLLILPPIDESLSDKIILLKIYIPEFPLDSSGVVNRQSLWETIKDELPGLIHHIEQFKIPPKLRDSRFGLTGFQHPILMESLEELNPEGKLLALIDHHLLDQKKTWEGTTTELESELLDYYSDCRRRAEKIIKSTPETRTYLMHLKKKHPNRISTRESNGKSLWVIRQP
jgi:hypothetical protein|tara:strand:- start:296 stop:1609 length:1314 start_codon:yes stop_codon:yes gene_type:complete